MEPKQPDAIGNWEGLGRPMPPPHTFKARVLLGYAFNYGLQTLVETGTCVGEMITSVAHGFARIYTVELDENLHAEAQERYGAIARLLQGDSAGILGAHLAEFLADGPALFWLDAHTPDHSAIIEELEALATVDIGRSVILADDVRLLSFTRGTWPDIEDVLGFARVAWPEREITVEDDILRITPRRITDG